MENFNLRKFLRKQAYERIAQELKKFKERMIKRSSEEVIGQRTRKAILKTVNRLQNTHGQFHCKYDFNHKYKGTNFWL